MTGPLESIAALVAQQSGIQIADAQLSSLEAAMRRVDRRMDAATFMQALDEPSTGPTLLKRLVDEVTVQETFFFRQRPELDAIPWTALLEGAHAAQRESIRVWVAGCASGEEAYTIAILACETFATQKPPVSILATDISVAALDQAERGRYTRRSVRSVEREIRERHFAHDGHELIVADNLRRLVELRQHNLVRDPIPPIGEEPFDLILCRNVLIYFDGETVERVIERLEKSLQAEGMLVLGAADRLVGSARRLSLLGRMVRHERSRAPSKPRRERELRRPLGREAIAEQPLEDRLTEASSAANESSLDVAIATASSVLADDPLNADAYFIRGLAELGTEDASSAVRSFRRSLYIDPAFALAAFQLGRAHDRLGDGAAARRAYEQALRTLNPDDARQQAMLEQIDLGDIAAACRVRIKALSGFTAHSTENAA